MPIELEYKYILSEDPDYENRLKKFLIENKFVYNVRHIEQHYLAGGGRIRSSRSNNEDIATNYFCYKEPLKKGDGNIEFDMIISSDDFYLCVKNAEVSLIKNRYEIFSDNHKWEIDIFLHNEKSYFNLMEVEVKNKDDDPSTISLPSIVRNNIILKTLDDDRFTSKKLACRKHAKKLYKQLV